MVTWLNTKVTSIMDPPAQLIILMKRQDCSQANSWSGGEPES